MPLPWRSLKTIYNNDETSLTRKGALASTRPTPFSFPGQGFDHRVRRQHMNPDYRRRNSQKLLYLLMDQSNKSKSTSLIAKVLFAVGDGEVSTYDESFIKAMETVGIAFLTGRATRPSPDIIPASVPKVWRAALAVHDEALTDREVSSRGVGLRPANLTIPVLDAWAHRTPAIERMRLSFELADSATGIALSSLGVGESNWEFFTGPI